MLAHIGGSYDISFCTSLGWVLDYVKGSSWFSVTLNLHGVSFCKRYDVLNANGLITAGRASGDVYLGGFSYKH